MKKNVLFIWLIINAFMASAQTVNIEDDTTTLAVEIDSVSNFESSKYLHLFTFELKKFLYSKENYIQLKSVKKQGIYCLRIDINKQNSIKGIYLSKNCPIILESLCREYFSNEQNDLKVDFNRYYFSESTVYIIIYNYNGKMDSYNFFSDYKIIKNFIRKSKNNILIEPLILGELY